MSETFESRLDLDVAALLRRRGPVSDYHVSDIAQLREVIESRAAQDGPELVEVVDHTVDGPHGEFMIRLYRPSTGTATPVVVFFHGGGHVLGSVNAFDSLTRRLAIASGATVASVDYRLAPEYPYPVASDESYAALKWLVGNADSLDIDAERVAVSGDSAGGTLAIGAAMQWRDNGHKPDLAAMALMYPGLDEGFDSPSAHEFSEGFGLTLRNARWMASQHFGGDLVAVSEYAIPSRARDLSGLPRTIMATAEFDILRDSAEQFAARLVDARVQVTLTRYPGVIHGFMSQGVERGLRAINDMGALLKASW